MNINNNQIWNIFYFLGVMLMDNKIMNTSPDYLQEKSMCFFGELGKNEFICDVENLYPIQKKNIYEGDDFWKVYCERWNLNSDNYKIQNIINFILRTNIYSHNIIINNYKKYIGDIKNITDRDMSFKVHPKLLEYIHDIIDINSRYFKLLLLQ